MRRVLAVCCATFHKFCNFQVRGSPTSKPRQRMITRGFSCKSLTKLVHALNGNYVSRLIWDYARSTVAPPAGAGREAAGHTSEVLDHIGCIPPVLWSLRTMSNTFTIGTIYVIRAPTLTTFTLVTLTMTMTTQILKKKKEPIK